MTAEEELEGARSGSEPTEERWHFAVERIMKLVVQRLDALSRVSDADLRGVETASMDDSVKGGEIRKRMQAALEYQSARAAASAALGHVQQAWAAL